MVRILDLRKQMFGYDTINECSMDRFLVSELKGKTTIEGVKRVKKKRKIISYNRSKDKEIFQIIIR